MHIIFRGTINKNNQRTLVLLTMLLLVAIVRTEECQPFKFQTGFTRCNMTLQQCIPNPSIPDPNHPGPYFRFGTCVIEHCITLGAGIDCLSYVTIELDQRDCYHSCCKSKTFVPQQCSSNNLVLRSSTDKKNGILAIVLCVSALFLVVFASCVIVIHMKCFQARKARPSDPVIPVWRKVPFNDNKCNICDQYGSVIETACGHYFHLSCYKKEIKEQPLQGQCPKCQETSRKFRLWCSDCHEKYIKVEFDEISTAAELENYYAATKMLHLDCLKDIDAYLKTDVRLTSVSE